jgi:hypothetical protein
MTVARRLETGICHINDATVNDEPPMPFGGVKHSGRGRFGGRAARRPSSNATVRYTIDARSRRRSVASRRRSSRSTFTCSWRMTSSAVCFRNARNASTAVMIAPAQTGQVHLRISDPGRKDSTWRYTFG